MSYSPCKTQYIRRMNGNSQGLPTLQVVREIISEENIIRMLAVLRSPGCPKEYFRAKLVSGEFPEDVQVQVQK